MINPHLFVLSKLSTLEADLIRELASRFYQKYSVTKAAKLSEQKDHPQGCVICLR